MSVLKLLYEKNSILFLCRHWSNSPAECSRCLHLGARKQILCRDLRNNQRTLIRKRMTQPTLYIIAGCNGAGKTTASMSVLPDVLDCREFVNADEIAKGLSPFKPEEVAVEAGKLMLQRIDYLLSKRATFAI